MGGDERAVPEAPTGAWGCWRSTPLPHPWRQDITDTACDHGGAGDARCTGCWRDRRERPCDQLPESDIKGLSRTA